MPATGPGPDQLLRVEVRVRHRRDAGPRRSWAGGACCSGRRLNSRRGERRRGRWPDRCSPTRPTRARGRPQGSGLLSSASLPPSPGPARGPADEGRRAPERRVAAHRTPPPAKPASGLTLTQTRCGKQRAAHVWREKLRKESRGTFVSCTPSSAETTDAARC